MDEVDSVDPWLTRAKDREGGVFFILRVFHRKVMSSFTTYWHCLGKLLYNFFSLNRDSWNFQTLKTRHLSRDLPSRIKFYRRVFFYRWGECRGTQNCPDIAHFYWKAWSAWRHSRQIWREDFRQQRSLVIKYRRNNHLARIDEPRQFWRFAKNGHRL